jgi:predicted dehydrogenase
VNWEKNSVLIQTCRWGIVSTASIGRKNWQAIGRSGNATLVGVSSRSKSSAEKFIDENEKHFPLPYRPKAYEGHEQLLQDDDIDAIYLPLPTGLRKEWVIAAAKQGKHVLCEKPCAANVADLEEMIRACADNGVQFMDGVMFMHTERLQQMQNLILQQKQLGEIKRMATHFSFCAPPEFFQENIRSDAALEPQGCLGDLGWYAIRLAMVLTGGRLPTQVQGRILQAMPMSSPAGSIPAEFSGELFFDGGISASLYVSFVTGNQQWAVVSGTRGLLQVEDYVLPLAGNSLRFETRQYDFNPTGWDFKMTPTREVHETIEDSNMGATAAETNLFRTFSNLVLNRQIDPQWPTLSLQTQRVLDALLSSARNGSQLVEL